MATAASPATTALPAATSTTTSPTATTSPATATPPGRKDDQGNLLVIWPTALIRIFLFVPLHHYKRHGGNHYSIITNNGELRNGTYGMTIAAGENLAAKWGTFGFAWNIAIWFPALLFIPPLNLPFAVVDTIITVYISMATYYQTSYSPHRGPQCDPNRNPNFHNLQRPVGVNESFFEAAARLQDTTPKSLCESFHHEWQFGVFISVFYAMLSFLYICAFFYSLSEAKKRKKTFLGMLKAVGVGAFTFIIALPFLVAATLPVVLYIIPKGFFRCLPLSWKAPVRFGRRYAIKTGLGMERKCAMEMTKVKTGFDQARENRERYRGGEGQQNPLAEFLGIYDMFMLITQELHYLDMVHLSRVSKSVRESVLPAHEFDRRFNVFRMYTCQYGENTGLYGQKARCWTCTNQICAGCHQLPDVPQTTLLHHLDNCQPYCTPCYNTNVLRRRPAAGSHVSVPYCSCAPRPAKPNLFIRFIQAYKNDTATQVESPKLARSVCRECNLLPCVELLAIKELETKRLLRDGRNGDGEVWTKCARAGCGRDLGTGPRWWVCKRTDCGKECRSMAHRAWSKGQRDTAGDIVIGEEAV